ncbi:MFS transporter [Streptomyces ardesiacus]|uniref:MFS transporter n=1 Tax=Streptomyces ardesiacus TaxID=285564 RepID=UPI0036464956
MRQQDFSASDAAQVSAAFGAGWAIGPAIAGWLSDRIGRRRTLLVTLSAVTTVYLLLPALHTLPALTAAAFAVGLLFDAPRPAVLALVADLVCRPSIGMSRSDMATCTFSARLIQGPWHPVSGSCPCAEPRKQRTTWRQDPFTSCGVGSSPGSPKRWPDRDGMVKTSLHGHIDPARRSTGIVWPQVGRDVGGAPCRAVTQMESFRPAGLRWARCLARWAGSDSNAKRSLRARPERFASCCPATSDTTAHLPPPIRRAVGWCLRIACRGSRSAT